MYDARSNSNHAPEVKECKTEDTHCISFTTYVVETKAPGVHENNAQAGESYGAFKAEVATIESHCGNDQPAEKPDGTDNKAWFGYASCPGQNSLVGTEQVFSPMRRMRRLNENCEKHKTCQKYISGDCKIIEEEATEAAVLEATKLLKAFTNVTEAPKFESAFSGAGQIAPSFAACVFAAAVSMLM